MSVCFHPANDAESTARAHLAGSGARHRLEHTWPVGSTPSPSFDALVNTFEPTEKK